MRPKDPQGCCRCRTHLSCPHHCRRHRFLERPQGRSEGRFRSGFPRARHLWASSARSLQGARCPLRSLACPVTRSKPRRVHMMYARACACMCVHAHACCSSTHTWDAKGVAGVFWSGDQAEPDDVDGDHPSEASDGDSSPCTHTIRSRAPTIVRVYFKLVHSPLQSTRLSLQAQRCAMRYVDVSLRPRYL